MGHGQFIYIQLYKQGRKGEEEDFKEREEWMTTNAQTVIAGRLRFLQDCNCNCPSLSWKKPVELATMGSGALWSFLLDYYISFL